MKVRYLLPAALGICALILLVLLAAPASTADGPLTGIKVCLDPGHGGTDPGAVNADFGLYESHINLDVSFALRTLLAGDGATVVMTREDDTYHENRDRYTLCNAEQATILVSVHTNSVEDPTWDGAMSLYFDTQDGSDDRVLAQAIHDVLYPTLRDSAPDPDAFRDFGLSRFASGVLLKSDMPATMMEPVFMSHPGEAALLVQAIHDGTGALDPDCAAYDCRRGQIAQAIHQGVLNYYGLLPPPPTPTPEPGRTMYVAAIDMGYQAKGRNYTVSTQVAIHDTGGERLAGAAVTVVMTQPDGATVVDTAVTGDDGLATFALQTRQTGTFESEVTGVTRPGWSYVPEDNAVTSVELDVP